MSGGIKTRTKVPSMLKTVTAICGVVTTCQTLCLVLWEGISVTLLSLVSLPLSPSLRNFLAFSTVVPPYRLVAL